MVLKVATDLAAHFDVALQYVNLVKRWETSPPEEARGESLHDYLREVCCTPSLPIPILICQGGSEYLSIFKFRVNSCVSTRLSQEIREKAFCKPFRYLEVVCWLHHGEKIN